MGILGKTKGGKLKINELGIRPRNKKKNKQNKHDESQEE